MKKVKQNIDFMVAKSATNETASPSFGVVFVRNEPLPFNGHSLDVDVCMKTGVNLSPVNMNVITSSNDNVSEHIQTLVNHLENIAKSNNNIPSSSSGED